MGENGKNGKNGKNEKKNWLLTISTVSISK